ncbi:MAG TPA: hypothetical protein VL307_10590, partial [Chitinophagaceae bacterium]|nr:hypothetical protein [Chitinophagaceae bacterium]
DYLRLSGKLLRQTSVTLSASTLKRIFGKLKTPERYYPQKATRDALAVYAGYKSWDDLTVHHRPVEEDLSTRLHQPAVAEAAPSMANAAPEAAFIATKNKRNGRWQKKALLALLCMVVLAALVFWLKGPASNRPARANILFSCINPDGQTPHTANFQLQVQQETDETRQLLIDFGDGRAIEPVAGRKNFSHYYETPGRYLCVIKSGTTALDTAVVYLKTKGWMATGNMPKDTTRVYPIEGADSSASSKTLVASIQQIAQAGIDTSNTFFVRFDNIVPSSINADNFEFATDVITSAQRPGVRCSQVDITIYGERYKHVFRVIKPGCEQWLDLQLAEKSRKNLAPDLSFLDADLSKGGKVKLKVVDKNATIYINDKIVFSGGYTQPLHKVYGVSIMFSGVGAIRSFYLKDNNTSENFPGSFE